MKIHFKTLACGLIAQALAGHFVEAQTFKLPTPNYVYPVSAASFAIPPKDWMIGFNEEFALETSSAINVPIMPTNVTPRSLATINSTLYNLAGTYNVGLYRDIIPIAMIAPNGIGDQTYWHDIKNTLTIMKNLNVRLIMSFGAPLPEWMTVSGDCPIPATASEWATLKNNMVWSIGEFVAAMASDPDIGPWVKSHVLVEGFNEFDSVGGMINGVCKPMQSTPAQAADLQNGITWVINYYGIQIQTLTPSLVEENPSFLKAYYAAGGTGLPNLHLYPAMSWSVAQSVKFFETQLAAFQAVVPANMKNRIFVSETGIPESNSTCPTSILSDANVGSFYSQILVNPAVRAATEGVTFWRLYDLPQVLPYAPCESSYGIIPASGSGYLPSAGWIFGAIKYLE